MNRDLSYRPERALPTLGGRAASNLSFIRAAMERSGRFVSVPGWSGTFMGILALVATALSYTPELSASWPTVWVVAAAVACPVNACSLFLKARRQGLPLLRGGGSRLLVGMCPPLVAGAALTMLLWQAGRVDLLPPTWLLLYGAAVIAGGAFTLPIVPAMGASFMFLGLVACFTPASLGLPLLALGFGGLHVFVGTWIGVRHGG